MAIEFDAEARLLRSLRVRAPDRRPFAGQVGRVMSKDRYSITADTALRLSRFFGTSERFWMNLQSRYELEVQKDRLGGLLERDVEVFAEAR